MFSRLKSLRKWPANNFAIRAFYKFFKYSGGSPLKIIFNVAADPAMRERLKYLWKRLFIEPPHIGCYIFVGCQRRITPETVASLVITPKLELMNRTTFVMEPALGGVL